MEASPTAKVVNTATMAAGGGSPASRTSIQTSILEIPKTGSPEIERGSMEADLLKACSPDANAAEPSSYELLVQGVVQTIQIPPKTMLIEVMKKMPSKKEPVFKCTKYSSDRFEASVELDVSGSRVTVEPGVNLATIAGDVAASPKLSQVTAVKKAFEYLEKSHFVHVTDYSSEVVSDYEDNRVWGDVNSVGYTLEKVLSGWGVVIEKIVNFHSELERNVFIETKRGVRSVAGDVYAETENFIGGLLNRYREKYRSNESAYKEYEAKRSKHLRESNDKVTRSGRKGYRQVIDFTMKDVLACVLIQLGLSPAEYTNEPSEGGQFTAEVVLHLPVIEDARCGGRTRFRGYLRLSAAGAEEDAAYKALCFMESRLKLTIVDMNYLDKVEAEVTHQSMVHLLRNMLKLAENIEHDWSTMNDYLEAGADMFDGAHMRNVTGAEFAAVKFCEESMTKLRAETNIAYKDALAKMKLLEKYYPTTAGYDD